MTAFDSLQNYYIAKNLGGLRSSRSLFRNESAKDPAHVIDTEIVREGEPIVASVEKGHMKEAEEAEETAEDHGVNPDSPEGREKVMELLEGIRKKNADAKRMQNIQKARPRVHEGGGMPASMENRGQYPSSQPEIYAVARARRKKKKPSLRGDVRREMGSDWDVGAGDKPHGSEEDVAFREEAQKRERELAAGGKEKAIINMEKASVSPHLARLLAAAAGWALSGDIAGKVDPHLAQEWERASSMHDKRRLQEDMMRQMHQMKRQDKPKLKIMVIRHKLNKALDDFPAFDDLNMFYKDHAPIPPRYGLMWDAVKHRWTRPEKIGRTVWEVQGKKRYRGSGTGAHERGRRAGGSGGYGAGSAEAGRRFRSTGDIGRLHPHESKHPGQQALHRFGKVRKLPKRR